MIHHHHPPSPSPSPSPENPIPWLQTNPPSKPPVRFSPPLIAMVVIIATAFITITYSRAISRKFLRLRRSWRQWRRRRRLLRSYVPSSPVRNGGDVESPGYSPDEEEPYDPTAGSYGYSLFSPYRHGLDDNVIKTIPLSVHTRKSSVHECAVCLLEFEDDDYVRTLPVCFHAFHVDCIDVWLRCHANCPLCRASVFRPESPFVPVMSARIRPDFDDVMVLSNTITSPQPHPELSHVPNLADSVISISEITQETSPMRIPPSSAEERYQRRDFLLKRSYSFGFERNIGSERLVMEPATVSPWRYRRGGFWNKRPSPFSSLTKSRVFSFRNYRGMKSPFFRRRGGSFLSGDGGGGSTSRRRKSFASPPIFLRQSGVNSGMFSSSRLRSGDPEALLSPERYSRR